MRHGMIYSNQFVLKPKMAPGLDHQIEDILWNCANQTLEVTLTETSALQAFAWFGTINQRYNESQESLFVDLSKDTITLELIKGEEVVATMLFRNLKLTDHTCWLAKLCDKPLTHHIVIHYGQLNVLTTLDKREGVDKEWSEDA